MRRTILLADDSTTIQRLVTQTFADLDFDIVAVSNGDAAIRKLEDLRPDAVLADIYMPGRNGYEVCAYIKSRPAFGAIPVIMLVGAFDAFDEDIAKQAGASASITKPFEPQALINLVMSVLAPEGAEAPPAKREARETAAAETAAVPAVPASDPGVDADLLGLEELFRPVVPEAPEDAPAAVSAEDVERIADRVIQKLSTQVIESIAWDVVPDITEKILREELKKLHEI